MAQIEFKNVNKTYSTGIVAIKDFSLDIRDGDFVVFVGPSGCGKSTILRMLAGLEQVTSGEIWMDGKCINDLEAKDRDMSMVFQNYALYPHMTVFDNIAFGLKLKKLSKDKIIIKVKEAAKILNISDLLDASPNTLSGGQMQRVAIARAIVKTPKVFLMDEPLSNLDAKLRSQMRIELAKLHQNLGSTVVYVTHDQVEAMTLGTKVIVMKDGVIQQIGTPQELYHHPANMFVAGFIGFPQMNFEKVEYKIIDEQEVLLFGKGYTLKLPGAKGKALIQQDLLPEKTVLGIRPQSFSICFNKNETKLMNMVKGRIMVVQSLGSETVISVDIAGNHHIIAIPGDIQLNIGGEYLFKININDIYLFDELTQIAI